MLNNTFTKKYLEKNNINNLIEKITESRYSKNGINDINKYLVPQFLYCDIFKWASKYTIFKINNGNKIDNTNYKTDLNISIRHIIILLNFYANDYKIFNLNLPEFICDIVMKEWHQKFLYSLKELNRFESINILKPIDNLNIRNPHKLETMQSLMIDILNLWFSIIKIKENNNLSCFKRIKNCIFQGNCILNLTNNTNIGRHTNIFDSLFVKNIRGSGFFLENEKLFLCGIPKNALTLWKNVLTRILSVRHKEIKL